MRKLLFITFLLILFGCNKDDCNQPVEIRFMLDDDIKSWVPNFNQEGTKYISSDSIIKTWEITSNSNKVQKKEYPDECKVYYEENNSTHYKSIFNEDIHIWAFANKFGQYLQISYNDLDFTYNFTNKKNSKHITPKWGVNSTIDFIDTLIINNILYTDLLKFEIVEINYTIPEHYPFTIYLQRGKGIVYYVERCGISWEKQ
jgi:hypothetical protein